MNQNIKKSNNEIEEINLEKVEVSDKFSLNNKIYPSDTFNPTQVIRKDEKFYNNYATKKTFSNGLMDGALLATNAGQLRLLLADGFINPKDAKWVISMILVCSSIIAQVLVLIILGYLANNNLANKSKKIYLNIMNNVVLILTGAIFCSNIISNVFIQVDFTEILDNKNNTNLR